jgi:hypothetical protein
MAQEVHASNSVRERAAIPLRRLARRPEWLLAALDSERVRAALMRQVPEFASGALRLRAVEAPRLMMKDTSGRWRGVYELTVGGIQGAERQAVPIRVTLFAPGRTPPESAEPRPFGEEGWQCYLADLRLRCELEPPEQALEILPQLTDPEGSRALLERGMREGAAERRDLRIQECRPEVLNYKPGSRCTILYHLSYDAAGAGRGWPTTAVAKVYRGRKGEQAYEGMVELWRSALAKGDIVRIAEPLAYVPELRLLVQATLPEEQTLEQFLRAALRSGTAEDLARLERFVRAAAAGLAAVHLSGARTGATETFDERFETVPEALERIAAVEPDLAASIAPLAERLRTLAASHPADAAVPSHGSFDGDQVLIDGDRIGFIDFDSFCMAEPALDVSHFRAAIIDSGMKQIDEATLRDPAASEAYLDRLSALADAFLAEYEAHAPISRERLTLWETWDYLRDALHLWTKPKLAGAEPVVRLLEYHLGRVGWIEASR